MSFIVRDFLDCGVAVVLCEGEIMSPDARCKAKPRRLIHTSPSSGSSTAFFFAVFLLVVAVVDLVWRAELRVGRVDVDTESASSSSPRFLLARV